MNNESLSYKIHFIKLLIYNHTYNNNSSEHANGNTNNFKEFEIFVSLNRII